MSEDPSDVLDALDRAEDAFGGYATGTPEYEAGLDPDENDVLVIQLRKGCRLLEACRTLREHDEYHTSVIRAHQRIAAGSGGPVLNSRSKSDFVSVR